MKIETTLTETYVPNWTITHAMREVISNAIDGERDGAPMTVRWSPAKGRLTVRNEGATVPTEALLLGHSGSRKDADKIGEFGEGLPLALLVIARSSRFDVRIVNNDEAWVPSMVRHTDLDANVLQISTRRLKEGRGFFEVRVDGLTPEDWDTLQSMFLRLNRKYDPDKSVVVGKARVLTQRSLKGCVYNKGVLVAKRDDLLAGYDLHETTNRDREIIDEWDLRSALSSLLSEGFNLRPDVFEKHVMRALEDEHAFEARSTWSLRSNGALVSHVASEWQERHGEDAVPVESMAEAKEIAHLGKRGVVVSSRMKEVLDESHIAGFEEAKADLQTAVRDRFSWDDLTEDQQWSLDRAVEAVGLSDLVPDEDVLKRVNVVEFNSTTLRGTYDQGSSEVRLSKAILDNPVDTIHTLIHEVAHAAGGDGSVEHERRQVDIAAGIISTLLDAVTALQEEVERLDGGGE